MDMSRDDPRLNVAQLEIQPQSVVDATVKVLGSKSYTNRALTIAALARGSTTVINALRSEDTIHLARALEALGHVRIEQGHADTLEILPTGRPMKAPGDAVYLGNAGTGLRFFTSVASLADGCTHITGNTRMQERPIGDLISALRQLRVQARTLRDNGSPPVEICGPSLQGGSTSIRGSVSSQFTSSLLIAAPKAASTVEVLLEDDLVSKPYVDMTIDSMRRFGVEVGRSGYDWFQVSGEQPGYQGGTFTVEPDASGMSYFLAAAAILKGRVRIPGIGPDSVQGDVGLLHVLGRMGCRIETAPAALTLEGGELEGIDVDMESMPDTVPTLAVVAAFAHGETHISGIGNLRLKECDRIAAVANELTKMGIRVHEQPDALTITGGTPKGAVIDTYDDHRIAMSFAIAGLRTPGVVIRDPGCVVKSFPTFWQALDQLKG